MFPLFLKIFSFPPSRLSRKVFTTFKVRGFSSYSSPPKVSVSVWWHIDSCPVPSGFSFSKVAPSITAAVRANGIMGTIRIRAYGDVVDKEALNSTNITLHSFFDDYPFPLHKTYTATIMWEWSSMLNGDDLTGKHFNYPPDGPTNSCYENSNAPLENPFSVVELHTSSQNSEEISKPTLDIKSFSRQVMKILCSHPNGISIGDLRAELTKCDVPLVKRFYGNKKFSDFLISISYVELQYLGGDNFWVCLVPSTTSAVKNNQKDGATTQKVRNDGKNMDRSADGVPKISSSCVSSEGDDLKSFQSIPSQGKPLGEYADGKSSYFCSWISSWWTFLKSRASHFEEPKSSELQQDLSHPLQPHWDNFKFRVAVWWDFDSCGVPSGISFLNVAPSIMGVLRANRIKGPIHIDAYGDVSQLSQIKQEALFLSGIDLHHVPGGKNKNKCFVDWFS
ncbi:uncharacterized protein [Medicago truncatula]|uniref:uncharacterized protein isoform X3 n=1 Tax=Medicago truncatula TaxID=3880 RepID=UPI001967FDCB|nr:uncharacterized protein LOC25493560 isoform X3 [Medicago truncatula]